MDSGRGIPCPAGNNLTSPWIAYYAGTCIMLSTSPWPQRNFIFIGSKYFLGKTCKTRGYINLPEFLKAWPETSWANSSLSWQACQGARTGQWPVRGTQDGIWRNRPAWEFGPWAREDVLLYLTSLLHTPQHHHLHIIDYIIWVFLSCESKNSTGWVPDTWSVLSYRKCWVMRFSGEADT